MQNIMFLQRMISLGCLCLLCSLFGMTLSVPVDLQVSLDPNRPVGLYEGPPTYRRDARGQPFKSVIIRASASSLAKNSNSDQVVQSVPTTTTLPPTTVRSSTSSSSSALGRAVNDRPFKSIIVTSKPFGFGSADSNFIRDRPTSPTTTTTASPLLDGKSSPTIPFFSISCTVGSSCSQIISARQTSTVKPTFKPYTQEEISKFKGTLSSVFPSSILTASLGLKQKSATTAKPSATTSNSVWRVRTTTTPAPQSSFHNTVATSIAHRNNKPSNSINRYESSSGGWKWPTDQNLGAHTGAEDRNHQEEEPKLFSTTTPPAKLSTWTPQLDDGDTSHYPVRKQTSYFKVKPHPFLDYQRHRVSPTTTTTTQPVSGNHNGGGWMSLLAASFNGLQHHLNRNNSSAPSTDSHKQVPVTKHSSSWASVAEDTASNNVAGDTISVSSSPSMTWSKDNHREVISNKGNKVSLITGQKTGKPSPPVSSSVFLPPEVSVSSHVIGLRVKPKSLDHSRPFTEKVQGVQVETDGENTNLSDLIMRENLPQRPARFPAWQRPGILVRDLAQDYHNRRQHQERNDSRFHHHTSSASEWRHVAP